MICHYSYDTVGVPGMLVRSVGQTAVDHRLPLEQRWGGWYVTGTHGSIHHLGNADVRTLFGAMSPIGNMNWPSLQGQLDTTGYLSQHSDITALMVFASDAWDEPVEPHRMGGSCRGVSTRPSRIAVIG